MTLAEPDNAEALAWAIRAAASSEELVPAPSTNGPRSPSAAGALIETAS